MENGIIKRTRVLFPSSVSVQFSCSVMSDSLRPHEPQHARPSCPSPAPVVYPNSCPLSRWCHPTISSSVIPFSCLQSFPAQWPLIYMGMLNILWRLKPSFKLLKHKADIIFLFKLLKAQFRKSFTIWFQGLPWWSSDGICRAWALDFKG